MNMKVKILASLMFSFFVFSFSTTYAAVKLTYAVQNSIYRKIDKKGTTIPKGYKKDLIPGVGVGNIIFAPGDLPFQKEDEYKGVGTKFKWDEVKDQFTARAYFPAKRKDIIAYVKSIKPEYELDASNYASYGSILWKKPNGYEELAGTSFTVIDDETLEWDQSKDIIFPSQANNADSSFNRNIENVIEDKENQGEHTISMAIYFRFNTGKYHYVTRWEGDTKITDQVPYVWDYLIAYGEAKVTK